MQGGGKLEFTSAVYQKTTYSDLEHTLQHTSLVTADRELSLK